jgi:hypothetical protein
MHRDVRTVFERIETGWWRGGDRDGTKSVFWGRFSFLFKNDFPFYGENFYFFGENFYLSALVFNICLQDLTSQRSCKKSSKFLTRKIFILQNIARNSTRFCSWVILANLNIF